jgi:hypothetical protein
MATLFEALPNLVHDIESALIRIGRGGVADQLREVVLERWTYDDFANVGVLYLRSPRAHNVVDRNIVGVRQGETLCPSDDLAINLDLDSHGRLTSIELLDGGAIIGELEKGTRS